MELITDDFDAVLIIGNGFDLNLGLKTSYTDFIKSSEFNILLNNDNQLAKHLIGVHTLQNWIDIENELKKFSKGFPSKNQNLFIEFKELSLALTDYLKNIKIPELDENNLSVKLLKSIESLTTLIIDFNYTASISSLANYLELDIYNEHSEIQHIKIHGSLKDNNIIFGVEDKSDLLPKHIFLKKSVNNSFKPINFSNAISNCTNFIIFGHSLGATDHMYFEDYFKKSSHISERNIEQNIVVYHYGEESYYDIYAQIDKLTLSRITKLKQQNTIKFIDTK